MEDTHSYPKTNNNVQDKGRSTNDPENAELLDNIHKKVTNYILHQVDMHFQKIDHVHHEQNENKNRINQHEHLDKVNPMTTSSCTMEETNTSTCDSNKLENKQPNLNTESANSHYGTNSPARPNTPPNIRDQTSRPSYTPSEKQFVAVPKET
ncbi:unnamed protein product [Mytilus coruscus]|uniref:Uncharacterized protein n=1 Tax=Mytilus coruscus TaxID=42192 RepID=A0A6J8BSZ5_MYTCO|nr:unnamed protein product [Mytilus coruscus]